ncbi:translationally controlled tumor protein [Schizosaccharomyces cryophilus OY26]|uniref:Translationally-controlled tumor protein homolog n=1 Tax=Schizosaccharomyces cryophilus (strain OY26 / ATCC MYA-4695 / CBS 11777 / NBRC 106824 / NRRL Y48691) TaxID=653667 RepID=S9X378_SCHCR|nr:translationally controlled tumor protein [Schizosaccharomyces cryophilus OY26]EPY51562.1 translationally controlled tumor protein [Schizosaccharomyces cryophilus OY26]
MLLFKDAISGDELVSDAYDLKEVDDIVYEADCQMLTIKQGGDIDIGANPSAEDGADATEEGTETVNNLVYSFRLNPTSFDKKSYMSYIKGYMKTIKGRLQEKNPERVPIFEKKAVEYVKKILANFNDYDFFIGESMDPDAMVVLMNYREDGMTPYMTFFKDGLDAEKF